MYDIGPVRDAAATILGQHIVSVQHAVLVAEELDDRRLAGSCRSPTRSPADGPVDGRPVRRVGAATWSRRSPSARSTASATIRAAVDVHQQRQAAAGVRRIADGEIDDPDRFLREALADAARLEAHLVEHVGHRAEAMGRSRDDVVTFWTDAASNVVDIVDVPGLDIVRRPGRRAAMHDEFADARGGSGRATPRRCRRRRRPADVRVVPRAVPPGRRRARPPGDRRRTTVSSSRGSSSEQLDAADRQTVRT